MVSEIPAFLLGLATLAVTANLFSRRDARALRRLHDQASLLPLLPEGRGREGLARHVDQETTALVAELTATSSPHRRLEAVVLAVAVTAGLVWVLAAVSNALWDAGPDWLRNVSLAGLVLLALSMSVMAFDIRRGSQAR